MSYVARPELITRSSLFSNSGHRFLRLCAAFSLVVVGTLLAVSIPQPEPIRAAAKGRAGKETICHRTSSNTNPYRRITVSKNAVKTTGAGHRGHTGNSWSDGAGSWGDIIPGVLPGVASLNYATSGGDVNNRRGEAIFNGTTYATVNYAGKCGTMTGVVGSAGTGSPNLLAYVPPAATTPTPSDPDPIATVPAQPATPIVESRNKAVVVSWTIPADGGSAIVGQIIRAYTGGRVVSSLAVDGAASSTRVTRLRNGVDYTFTVQARNAVGLGLESAPSSPVRPAR